MKYSSGIQNYYVSLSSDSIFITQMNAFFKTFKSSFIENVRRDSKIQLRHGTQHKTQLHLYYLQYRKHLNVNWKKEDHLRQVKRVKLESMKARQNERPIKTDDKSRNTCSEGPLVWWYKTRWMRLRLENM